MIFNPQAVIQATISQLENLGPGVAFYSLSNESKTVHYICGNLVKYGQDDKTNIIIIDALIGIIPTSKTASMYNEKFLVAFMTKEAVLLVLRSKPTYTPYANKYFFSLTQEGIDYITTLEHAIGSQLIDDNDRLTKKIMATTYQLPSKGMFIINSCPIEKYSPFVLPAKYLKSMDLIIDTNRYVYELHNGCFTEVACDNALHSSKGTIVSIESTPVKPVTRVIYLEV